MTTQRQDRVLNQISKLASIYRERKLAAHSSMDELHAAMEIAEAEGCSRVLIAERAGVSRERVVQVLGRRKVGADERPVAK